MIFSSKILLFGEYSVLQGSDALLIPFPEYSGYFDFYSDFDKPSHEELASNQSLERFKDYIQKSGMESIVDVEGFRSDLAKGLYFKSNIPTGYGVGSSGALVAAFYSRYVVQSAGNKLYQHLTKTKDELGELESFFHSKSSGFDPLVSLVNKPILSRNRDIVPVEVNLSKFHPFLIDTGIERNTASLVALFKDKMRDKHYQSIMQNELVGFSNSCIDAVLQEDVNRFFENIQRISEFQLIHLADMIPADYVPLWQQGLSTNKFYLKLCGAGGGGFILGFARDLNIKSTLPNAIII
jgi:mevalonate kinase